MAVLGETVPRIQVLAEEVHREIDLTLAKVHIILKKVTEIRREILETINLGIVINILVSVFSLIIKYIFILNNKNIFLVDDLGPLLLL